MVRGEKSDLLDSDFFEIEFLSEMIYESTPIIRSDHRAQRR